MSQKTKTNTIVVGGGISGLIAGKMLENKGGDFLILERSEQLAPLYLHYLHSDVGSLLNVKTKKVDVVKNVLWNNEFILVPNIEMMNAYSANTTGKITPNSLKFFDGKIDAGYIPLGGMETLQEKLLEQIPNEKILLEKEVVAIGKDGNKKFIKLSDEHLIEYENVISTIPLPFMLTFCGIGYNKELFKVEPLHMLDIKLSDIVHQELYQIVYIPNCDFGFSRFSILGDRIVAEFGLESFKNAYYSYRSLTRFIDRILPGAKIESVEPNVNKMGRYLPINEKVRVELIDELKKRNVFCLGRYAEWNYKRADLVTLDAQSLINNL